MTSENYAKKYFFQAFYLRLINSEMMLLSLITLSSEHLCFPVSFSPVSGEWLAERQRGESGGNSTSESTLQPLISVGMRSVPLPL